MKSFNKFRGVLLLLASFVFLGLFSVIFYQSLKPEISIAADESCDATLRLTVRDSDGDFIPNINFNIYKQVYDADDNPKPGASLASGKTNQYTGIGTVTFNFDPGVFVIKVWDEHQTVGAVYYYDNFASSSCPTELVDEGDPDDPEDDVINYLDFDLPDTEVDISALKVVLRDSQGVLATDTQFKLYTQIYDVDDDPLKDELVGTFNTESVGYVTTYVADKNRSVDGEFNGNYVIEIQGRMGGTFYQYNNKVNEAETTEVNYKFSDVVFNVKDVEDVPFPAGANVSIYEQAIDLDGEKILGDFIKTVQTNDKGVALFEYPEGTYAVKIVGGDDRVYNFFDIEIDEHERNTYTLKVTDTYNPDSDRCSMKSFLEVTARDPHGNILPGMHVALHKQEIDANGTPIATDRVAYAKTEATGIATLSFNPDPRTSYVLKIYENNDKAGEFWFFDDIQFYCDEDKEFSKTLSSLKIVLRDSNGALLKNYNHSIYRQKSDIDGNPINQKSDLVKSTKTSEAGYSIVYVSDDHPYDKTKKGTYALSVRYDNEEYVKYDIDVAYGEETVFEYILSAADIEEEDADPDPGGSTDSGTGTQGTYSGLFERLQGYILLQVEERGEAWYVDADSRRRYYMKDGPTAYEMMRKFGLGITNENLAKIPVGIDDRFEDSDIDGDGLQDKMEEALGSDIYDADTDDDGFLDGDEVRAGYSPISSNPAKLTYDTNLSNQLLGKILLQVESRGEAWYLNPSDGKRYYMKNGDAAYQIMRFLSLGITNVDLQQIDSGSI